MSPVSGTDVGDPRDLIGAVTGRSVLTVERGPVSQFARAVKDGSPVFHDGTAAADAGFPAIPAPPTFAIAVRHWGAFAEQQPPDGGTEGNILVDAVMGLIAARGGIMLHGEQQFDYHRPLVVGQTLHHEGRVVDVYEKESKGRTMTFFVADDEYRDSDGELVVTSRLTLIHRA